MILIFVATGKQEIFIEKIYKYHNFFVYVFRIYKKWIKKM